MLALAHELVVAHALVVGHADVHHRLFDFGVGHLRCDCPFPYQLIQPALRCVGGDDVFAHVGGADSLVSLLRSFGLGLVAAGLHVFVAIHVADFIFGHAQCQVAQVHAVGTHVGDESVLVQLLRYLHGACHTEAQLAAGLLLQCRGGEGRRRGTLCRFRLNTFHLECAPRHAVQECGGLVLLVESAAQLCQHLGVPVGGKELCRDAEVALADKVLDFLFALHYQADGHALHTSRTQCRLDFRPQDGANLITHDAVEHATGLLCIHQIHVDGTRMLDGVEYGVFGYLVKDNALGFGRVQLQGLLKMPCNSLSLAVLIGCQPHGLGLFHCPLQVRHQFVFLFGNHVPGFVLVVDIDAHLFLREVADMSAARQYDIVRAEKLLNLLRFGW